MLKKWTAITSALLFLLSSCKDPNASNGTDDRDSTGKEMKKEIVVKEEAINYSANGVAMKGFVAFDEKLSGPRPVVLVVPEWWGLTEYPRMRAKKLAELGYFAVVVDMYGDGKIAADPEAATAAATPFYGNPQMGKERIDAALAKAKTFAQADSSKVAAIGYCFGGSMVLNYAKLNAPVAGVVSFHGDLRGVPPQKGTKAQFLICHGGADDFVPQAQVDAFKKSMDSAGISYTFKAYDGATHAFTNPDATKTGEKFKMPIRYNAAADTASWNEMKNFFTKIF